MFFFSRNKGTGELIKSGSLKKIQQRIDATNCNAPDEQGMTPLHHAIVHQQAAIAHYLLSLGCEPVVEVAGQRRPAIQEAVLTLSLPLIEVFLAFGASLPEYIDGLPLLHTLVRRKELKEIHVAYFMQQGIDLNRIDTRASGKTVLAYYLSLEDIVIDALRLEWLINLGADVNLALQPWATPLYQALTNPALRDTQDKLSATTLSRVLDALARGGLDVNLDMQSCDFKALPLEALERGHFRAFVKLLKAGINIEPQDKAEIASYLTSENFPQKRVSEIFEINQQRELDLPISILIHDIRRIKQIVDELPNNAPNIDEIFRDLITATGFKRDEKLAILNILFDKGADINIHTHWANLKISALQIMAGWPDDIEHSDALLNWLLDHGAAIEYHGLSAFYLAIWLDQMETASLLAARGANLLWEDCKKGTVFSYLFTQNPKGTLMPISKVVVALHQLQEIYHSQGVALPLETPFNYNKNDTAPLKGNELLAEAIAMYNADDFVRLATVVLELGWPLNAIIKGEYFSGNIIAFFLHYAHSLEDISPLLRRLPEPLDLTSEHAGDPLRQAIFSCVSQDTIRYLLPGNEVNRTIGRHLKGGVIEYTEQPLLIYALHCVDINKDEDIGEDYAYGLCRMLLQQGADPNAIEKRRTIPGYNRSNGVRLENTVLEWSAIVNHFAVFSLLLDRGADPSRKTCIKQEQFVHFACTRMSSRSGSTIIRYLDELERRGLLEIEALSGQNATPLLMAVSKCQRELVRYFLDRGANPNAIGGFDNSSALHRALTNWDWVNKDTRRDTVKMLLDAGTNGEWIDPDGDTPLICAAAYGCLAALEVLLEHGVNPNQATPKGRTALHEVMLRPYSYDTYPDDEDCEQEHEFDHALKHQIVERLLAYGANINAADENGDTPLSFSIRTHRESLFGLLIEQGADLNQADKVGYTPLMNAAQYADTRYFDALWHREDVQQHRHQLTNNGNNLLHIISLRRDNTTAGQLFKNALLLGKLEYRANERLITPLHYAAYLGNHDVVTFCCERGMDVNAADDGENTPLHAALFFDEEEVAVDQVRQIVTSLLTAGADPGRANAAGETPMMIASRRNLTDCVSLMSMMTATSSGFGSAGPRLS